MKAKNTILTVLLSSFLIGCGGGGSSDSATVEQQEAQIDTAQKARNAVYEVGGTLYDMDSFRMWGGMIRALVGDYYSQSPEYRSLVEKSIAVVRKPLFKIHKTRNRASENLRNSYSDSRVECPDGGYITLDGTLDLTPSKDTYNLSVTLHACYLGGFGPHDGKASFKGSITDSILDLNTTYTDLIIRDDRDNYEAHMNGTISDYYAADTNETLSTINATASNKDEKVIYTNMTYKVKDSAFTLDGKLESLAPSCEQGYFNVKTLVPVKDIGTIQVNNAQIIYNDDDSISVHYNNQIETLDGFPAALECGV